MMKLFTAKQRGDAGEDYTVRYLRKNGYKILERNYRQKCGEIDIIAQHGEYIVFVEVKTRSANFLARPYEAVDRKKISKIRKTAAMYIAQKGLDAYFRFDVSEVFTDPQCGKVIDINYIENAFEGDSYESI